MLGEMIYAVILGFVLIWVADVFRLWERYDVWRGQRRELQERGARRD